MKAFGWYLVAAICGYGAVISWSIYAEQSDGIAKIIMYFFSVTNCAMCVFDFVSGIKAQMKKQ
jgi:hypothetical protein